MVDATIEVLLQAIQQPQSEHVVRFMAPSLVVRSSARVELVEMLTQGGGCFRWYTMMNTYAILCRPNNPDLT